MSSYVEQFLELFRGRGDCYGSWEGGCVRRPVDIDTYRRHLDGTEMVGIYPAVPAGDKDICAWGCIDIDIDDLDGARNLQTILQAQQVYTHVERTRKGYHVWCFAAQIVGAITMRHALLAAHQVLNYPAKEVNPKQEYLNGKIGNYVRLPYPGAKEGIPENRYMLDDNDQPIDLHGFLTTVKRTSLEALESTAAKYVAPVLTRDTTDWETAPSGEAWLLIKEASPLTKHIWRNGVHSEGGDRSSTLVKLAGNMQRDGLDIAKAFVILQDADRRWGKFHMRQDGEEQIRKILRSVYGYE